MLYFSETVTTYTKISSRSCKPYRFPIKINLESFVSIYHWYHFFGIIYKSIFYNLNILHWWKAGSAVKPSISKVTLSKNDRWIPGILSCSMTYWFSFFSVITAFDVTSCIFILEYFNRSNSLVHFPVLLGHYNKWYNETETMK